MPACILRVSGRQLDVTKYLSESAFENRTDTVFHIGEPRTSGSRSVNPTTGFTVLVGEGDVAKQTAAAIAFVDQYHSELLRLSAYPGIEQLTLDFGWEFDLSTMLTYSYRFAPELLSKCGPLRIGLEVTLYLQESSRE